MTSLLEHALHYAEMGLSVVPLHSVHNGKCSCAHANTCIKTAGKHPRLKWKDQSSVALTLDDLTTWWRRYPDSNIGIVTGQVSGVVVIDIDGQEGVKALLGVGLDIDEISTPAVQTGSGGLHIYCKYPEEDPLMTRAGVLPKVDIRADGGIIVAPPSAHYSGSTYQWIDGMSLDDLDLITLDLTWARASTNGHAKINDGEFWFEQIWSGVREGTRNASATRLAGRYLGLGMTPSETLYLLEAWNESNEPPLPRKDLETVVDSIARREASPNGHLDRTEALAKISQALKTVQLMDIRRITGDEPQFILAFREGTCQITTEGLLAPPSLQAAIAKGTKILTRKLSIKTTPTHAQIVQWIMDTSRDEDAGIEATAEGEIKSLVTDFLGAQRITIVAKGAAVPSRGCFKIDSVVWISLDDLIQWCRTKGARISHKQTAQQLKTIGWAKKPFKTDIDSTRVVWSDHG